MVSLRELEQVGVTGVREWRELAAEAGSMRPGIACRGGEFVRASEASVPRVLELRRCTSMRRLA